MPLEHLAVGHARPGRRCPRRGRRAGGRRSPPAPRNSSTSRPSIGCVRCGARRARPAPAGARSAARGSGTSASGRRSTIDARSATDSGAAASSVSSTARREARCARRRIGPRGPGRRGRRPGARRLARGRAGEPLGLAVLDVGESGAGGRVHRVDQVVGDLDAVQRRVQPFAGGRVAQDEVAVEVEVDGRPPRRGHASGRSRARRGRRGAAAGRARRRRSRETPVTSVCKGRDLPRRTERKTPQDAGSPFR